MYDLQSNFLIKLYQLFVQRISIEKGATDKYSIEFYLSMLFNHISIIPELHTEVEISFAKAKSQQFIRYRNISEGPFTLPNYTYKYIFQRISKENILLLYNIVLLDRKLILISDQIIMEKLAL